jgi:ABC-2 type transport system permease protein
VYRDLMALIRRELLIWVRSPIGIITSLVFPIMYLALFGQALNLGKLLQLGGPQPASVTQAAFLGAPDYFSYFSVGMVGFVALTASLFLGAQLIFDKRLGYVKKSIVAPIPRMSIFGGRLIAGAIRPLLLGAVVFTLALVFAHVNGLSGLTINGNLTVLGVGEIIVALLLLSLSFTGVFLAVGFLLEQPQSYFGVVNLLNLPLLFTSNALFPQSIMPDWLRTVSMYNPVSMAVNVMRENLFAPGYYPHPAEFYLGELALYAFAISVLAFLIARRGLAAK